jgi:long-subunit fatty acid transport protein
MAIPDPDAIRNTANATYSARDLGQGWRHGGRYLPQKSDISSVAFWYQAEPHSKFPKLPAWKELEVR